MITSPEFFVCFFRLEAINEFANETIGDVYRFLALDLWRIHLPSFVPLKEDNCYLHPILPYSI